MLCIRVIRAHLTSLRQIFGARPLRGTAWIARFSSQIVTHGKSDREKQYPIRERSFRFNAATKPVFFPFSRSTPATKPLPGKENGLLRSTLLFVTPGAFGQRNVRPERSEAFPSS